MKKTILALVIAVMVSTPCLAEVETEGLFSVDGTLWNVCADVDSCDSHLAGRNCDIELGFYQGKVYGDFRTLERPSYYDLGVVSIGYGRLDRGNSFWAIMLPTMGTGVLSWNELMDPTCARCVSPYCFNVKGTMRKTADHWAPPAVSATEWVRAYGIVANSIQLTSDGGYIVAGIAGSPYSSVIEEYGIGVLKLDESGNAVWQKTYGVRQFSDVAVSIQQTTDRGYIVASSMHDPTERQDMLVLKLDESGNVVWQKAYGGDDTDEYAMSIQQTTDGGYIVAGSFGFPTSGDNAWVLKLDESGNVVWQKRYGRSGEGANSIQQTTDGGYVVTGFTGSFGAGEFDMWVLKLDESGNMVWQKAYGGANVERANAIQQTADGGYIVAGETLFSFGAGVWDMLILKLDSSGDVSWSKTYGGDSWESANAIQQTTDGGYIVVGDTKTFDSYGDNAWLLKLDSSGNLSWEKSYGTVAAAEYGSFVQQTADGGYIVAVACDYYSFPPRMWDMWILKLNSSGEIPGCNITMTYPSHAIITEPSLSVKDTDVIAQPSNAAVISTGVSPESVSAMGFNPCE